MNFHMLVAERPGRQYRTRADKKFPDMWAVVKAQLDSSLKELYESQADAGVKVLTWLRSKRHLLALNVEESHLDAVIRSGGNFGDVPQHVKAIVIGSLTGKCMFKNVWLGCARSLYVKEVMQSLADLEHNDYSEAELADFRLLMAQKVVVLKTQGHRRMAWKMSASIHGEEISLDLDDPNDEWVLRLHSRVKTIAVNSRQVTPLWYEQLSVPERSLKGVLGFLNLPSSMLEPFAAARETAADLLKGVTGLSIAIKVITKARPPTH